MRKYLAFLDIDGVFCSHRVHIAHNSDHCMWNRFDPVAVDFMNYMYDTYPVEFVLSTSWIKGVPSDNALVQHWITTAFANSGFRGRLAQPFKTNPDGEIIQSRANQDRPEEIKRYLEVYGQDIEDYIIFDDSRYEFEEVLGKKRLVLTDPNNGMLFKHMLNAKSIMGNWKKKETI